MGVYHNYNIYIYKIIYIFQYYTIYIYVFNKNMDLNGKIEITPRKLDYTSHTRDFYKHNKSSDITTKHEC